MGVPSCGRVARGPFSLGNPHYLAHLASLQPFDVVVKSRTVI
jgi:hypothetical protein